MAGDEIIGVLLGPGFNVNHGDAPIFFFLVGQQALQRTPALTDMGNICRLPWVKGSIATPTNIHHYDAPGHIDRLLGAAERRTPIVSRRRPGRGRAGAAPAASYLPFTRAQG